MFSPIPCVAFLFVVSIAVQKLLHVTRCHLFISAFIYQQVSLRKGEILILCSDGAANEDTLQICRDFGTEPVPILGQRLLEQSRLTGQDDATAVIISLKG